MRTNRRVDQTECAERHIGLLRGGIDYRAGPQRRQRAHKEVAASKAAFDQQPVFRADQVERRVCHQGCIKRDCCALFVDVIGLVDPRSYTIGEGPAAGHETGQDHCAGRQHFGQCGHHRRLILFQVDPRAEQAQSPAHP